MFLKTTDQKSKIRSAELLATIVAAIVGGICLSLFEMQPVSATGAILQEAMNYADGSKSKCIQGLEKFDESTAQTIVVLRFLTIITAVIFGTMFGSFMCKDEKLSPTMPWLVSFLIFTGTVLTLFYVILFGGILTHLSRAVFSILFGFSIGLIWSSMPEDTQTTAKSALLKKAALGDLNAVFQIIFFAILCGLTVNTFSRIIHHNYSGLIPALALLVILIISSYKATDLYISLWDEYKTQQKDTYATIVGTKYYWPFFVMTALFLLIFLSGLYFLDSQ